MSRKPLSIVFMGTPEFAVPSLTALLEGEDRVSLVVTRPDRPKGRTGKPVKSPVRIVAEGRGIPVLTPENPSDPAFVERLKESSPDLSAVVAYGHILKKAVLEIAHLGTVNVHASLLPTYRGAAPIERSIINGETTTGVTTILLDEGIDSGDILLMREVPIGDDETAGDLTGRLSVLGAELLIETIGGLREGTIRPTPQDHAKKTLAPMLSKQEGHIDWGLTPREIKNRVRGMTPRPGAYTILGGEPVKIFSVLIVDSRADAPPGTVVRVGEGGIFVAAGGGILSVTELQAPGKKRMGAGEFLRGRRIPVGTLFQ